MTASDFQRARKPDQIKERREAILAAAAALFDAGGPEAAGLNAIAARAGFTKSNLYRYFESREAVLLSLFLSDFSALVTDIEAALATAPQDDLRAVAQILARGFVAHPRVGAMLAILSTVLERNVSAAGVLALKTEMFGEVSRLANALARALPQVPPEDCGWAATVIGTFVSGLWPAAHPTPIVAGVLARPEFAALNPSVERDLERMILTLFKGLQAEARA